MKKSDETKKYSTQRVDIETIERIKTISLHLSRRGIRMRQSDIIGYALMFAKAKEWEFIEFVETGRMKEPEGLSEYIFGAVSRPWFPYGDLVG